MLAGRRSGVARWIVPKFTNGNTRRGDSGFIGGHLDPFRPEACAVDSLPRRKIEDEATELVGRAISRRQGISRADINPLENLLVRYFGQRADPSYRQIVLLRASPLLPKIEDVLPLIDHQSSLSLRRAVKGD